MSWSVSAIGKSDAVAREVTKRLTSITYLTGEEEQLKDAAAEIVKKALFAQTPGTAVKVDCSGSASKSGGTLEIPDTVTQRISILVEPIYGFVE